MIRALSVLSILTAVSVAHAGNPITDWNLCSIDSGSDKTQNLAPRDVSAFEITLTLSPDTVSGTSGCNMYAGDYTPHEVPLFKRVSWTDAACESAEVMEMEREFVDLFLDAKTITWDERALILTTSSGEKLNFSSGRCL